MVNFSNHFSTNYLYLLPFVCMASCTIEVPEPPKANFSFAEGNGALAPSEVVFTNASTNSTSFNWDFGDGSVSDEYQPRHTYLMGGEFQVKLVAKGTGGSNGKSMTISIKAPAKPIASFTYTASKGGVVPSLVVFTNKSSGAKTYTWNFGDKTTSAEQHPQHTYTTAGQYLVKLIAKGDGGEDDSTQTILIIASAPAVAAFDISGGNCVAPCKVSFINKSSNATDYLWDFGSGVKSVLKDLIVEFPSPGIYNVALTATGPGGKHTITKSVTIIEAFEPEMVAVEGGEFLMGSLAGDADEQPVKKVTLSSYSIGKYPVTVKEYQIFCNETGYSFPSDSETSTETYFPINNVNYADATSYCEWLSKKTRKTYRLPTEAEWEYAARGGNKSNGYIYSGSNNLSDVGNYLDVNRPGTSIQFGSWKKGNELGLFEMSGNVEEWCSDWYLNNYYVYFPASNPIGPSSGSDRVTRGGHLHDLPYSCRVAKRDKTPPTAKYHYLGFRIVLIQ